MLHEHENQICQVYVPRNQIQLKDGGRETTDPSPAIVDHFLI